MTSSTKDGRLAAAIEIRSDDMAHVEASAEKTKAAARGKGKKRHASIGRVIYLARPELKILSLATVALLVSSAASMAMPAFIGHLISSVTAADASRAALQARVWQLVAIFTVGGVFTFLRGYLFTLAGERVVARLRNRLFSHLMSQPISFYDRNKTGELMNRLSSDTTVLQNAATVNISMGLRYGVQVLMGIVVIFFYSWRLSAVMLSIVPLVAVIAVCYGKMVRRLSKKYQAALALASATAQEAFSGLRTVRSFAMEGREIRRYGSGVEASYKVGATKALAYGAFGGGIGTIAQYSIIVVLWYGGTLVLEGELETSDLVAFLLYTVQIAATMGGLTSVFSSLMNAVGASERVFALLDTEACSHGGGTIATLKGHIELTAVSFAYPSRPDVSVLRGVSLSVTPGDVVALCGPSGSGKSSIVALLEVWYHPIEGEILIDGVPLSSLDPSWWRRQVSLVAQEPTLFACSIRENMCYGCDVEAGQVDEAALQHAARTANAHDFVSSFPEGYETLVGERGVQLSGGQKQRVAIARAVMAEPSILILDEATSALDAEAEHLVQDALDKLMANRTTVLIAHRLSTVREASLICVLREGQVVERGKHEQLLANDGPYAALVRRQVAQGGGGPGAGGVDAALQSENARLVASMDMEA